MCTLRIMPDESQCDIHCLALCHESNFVTGKLFFTNIDEFCEFNLCVIVYFFLYF